MRARDVFGYPLATTFRPPNIRKILSDLSGRQDFLPTVECEHGYALLNVVLQSDTIGIACNANLRPYHRRGTGGVETGGPVTGAGRGVLHPLWDSEPGGYGLSPLAQGWSGS